MGILLWIVFGLIAGVVAKFLMPGRDPGGIIVTILLGIGGAIVGGFVATYFGFGDMTGFDLRSLVSNHNVDFFRAQRLCGAANVGNQGQTAKFMQDLRLSGFHSGS